MEQPTDADLVYAARTGDKRAFGDLVERYQPMATRIALRMIGDEELARDLAQEAILQAYLNLDRLRAPDRFGSWLHGIVLNVCRGFLRDQKIDFLSLESLAGGLRYDGPLLDAQAVEPLAVVEARELHQVVLAAVEALSEKNRTATLLFYYEQVSVREIAALLEVSVSAVKSRLYQARQQLKRSLAALDTGVLIPEANGERKAAMVQVTIADIVVNVKTGHRIVVLVDAEERQALPIWIGPFEADAILLALKDVSTARPMTHDFVANLLAATGMRLEEVRVESLVDETFYAVVKLHNGDRVQEMDARPSDAIALAVRTGSPLYVAEEVMAHAGRAIPSERTETTALEGWYYSPLREVKTDFPEEEAEKLPAQFARFVSFGQKVGEKVSGQKEDAPAEAPPSAEERARQKEESARTGDEVVAFVFGAHSPGV